jgi:hypothetical protein
MDDVNIMLFLEEVYRLSCCASDFGDAFLNGMTKEQVYILLICKESNHQEIIIWGKEFCRSARLHEHSAES